MEYSESDNARRDIRADLRTERKSASEGVVGVKVFSQ